MYQTESLGVSRAFRARSAALGSVLVIVLAGTFASLQITARAVLPAIGPEHGHGQTRTAPGMASVPRNCGHGRSRVSATCLV
jgi:hypothetical protein